MKYFILFTIILAAIFIVVTLLINSMMGIFIVATIACLWLENIDKNNKNNKTEP